jgi:hypothetical protein
MLKYFNLSIFLFDFIDINNCVSMTTYLSYRRHTLEVHYIEQGSLKLFVQGIKNSTAKSRHTHILEKERKVFRAISL